MGVNDITELLGVKRPYWSAVENNHTVPSHEKLELIFKHFELNELEASNLRRIRNEVKQTGWWTRYSFLDDDVAELYGLEFGAARICLFDATVVSGLLQTEDYARALIEAAPGASEDDMAQLVEVRMRRQERWQDRNDPLRVQALLSEAVLLQQLGDGRILKEQMERLLDILDAYENVEIRILPFRLESAAVLNATIFLLEFDDRYGLPAVAHQEGITFTKKEDEETAVGNLRRRYDNALKASLSPQDSRLRIEYRLGKLADRLDATG